MPLPRLLLPILSFAAGLTFFAWRPGQDAGRGGSEISISPNGDSGRNSPNPLHTPPPPDEARDTAADLQAGLELTGLTSPPTMEEVLDAGGLDRGLRLALWLQTASSAEIAEMLQRCRREFPKNSRLRQALWERWMELDPASARKSPDAATEAGPALARLDPAGALREKGNDPEVLAEIAKADPERILAWLVEHPGLPDREIWPSILQALTERNPAAAAELVRKGGLATQAGEKRIQRILEDWGKRDSAAALNWALALKSPAERGVCLSSAFTQRAHADPAAAFEKASALPPGRARAEFMKEAAGLLALTDPVAAAEAVEKIPAGMDRAQALAGQVEVLADSDPGRAMDIFQKLITESGLKDLKPDTDQTAFRAQSYADILRHAARNLLPGQAQDTIETLARDLPGRDDLLQIAVQEWAGQDAVTASGWVERLPAGAARDAAVFGLTTALIKAEEPDFEAAIAWGRTAAAEERPYLLERVLKKWGTVDPAGALAALKGLGLPEERRVELEKDLQSQLPGAP